MTTYFDRLPHEIVDLIFRCRAASTIQTRWLRYSRFGHTRRDDWHLVRKHLCKVVAPCGMNMWNCLIPYECVRREWRCETAQWMHMDRMTAEVIRHEAARGMWGAKTPRLALDSRGVTR